MLPGRTALQAWSAHSLLSGALTLLYSAAEHNEAVLEAVASSPGAAGGSMLGAAGPMSSVAVCGHGSAKQAGAKQHQPAQTG